MIAWREWWSGSADAGGGRVTQGKAGMSRARCLRDSLSVLVVRVLGDDQGDSEGGFVPLCVCAGGLDAYNVLTFFSLSPRRELGRVPRRVVLLLTWRLEGAI